MLSDQLLSVVKLIFHSPFVRLPYPCPSLYLLQGGEKAVSVTREENYPKLKFENKAE
jgi:hypothetical protein